MEDVKKLLGKRIKELRKQRNFTQERLAEMIGIEPPNLSYIETGRFYPSPDTLWKIAKALDLKIYELYKFDYLKPVPELKKELYKKLENNDELVKLVYKICESL